ncbi:PREDICTED: putative sugar transporter ERD6-like 13 [Camelina sativa]|uniref:Sugar transporter ERD6-like 13 n=1 Tax=Camelina sativa TaxID=90675 RepID=A0ABM0T3A8_CAMSA|nr:PREDICTED: putative sugar transporter ERD6-like 13 [Camelina sativa]
MGDKPLLQKVSIQKDIESSDKGVRVNDGDGPVTLILLFTTFTALCGTFSYGTAAGFTSPAQTGIMAGLNLSLAEFSFFGSVLTIGGLVGAAMSGKLADILGRRGALWVSNSFCMAGWLMIAFSQETWSLDIGRLFLGVAAGLASYVVPVYIVEIAPKKVRGAFSAINSLVMCGSVAVTFLVGSVISWQKLALISTVPCVLEFVGLFFIPESPRWLIYMENLQEFKEDGFFELFNPRYSRVITVGIGLLVLQQLGGLSGYTFYLSSIFKRSGFPNNVGVMVASVVQSVSSVIGIIIVDKFRRRSLLTVATVMMCLGSLITGLAFLFQSYDLLESYTPISTLMGVLVFQISITIGIGGIPWVMVSEMTPINIKGSAGTLCNLTSWSSNWFVAYTFNFLFQWSSSGVFFIYTIISGVGILFVTKMVPETRGRSLEEIQASITR